VASGRDLSGLRGGIVASERVGAFVGFGTRLLACILGSNGCNAFLFLYWSWQGMQVPKTLPPGSAEVLAKKEESGSFLMQAEQYFEDIPDVEAILDVKAVEL